LLWRVGIQLHIKSKTSLRSDFLKTFELVQFGKAAKCIKWCLVLV
jgi:hypothetical protein